MKMNELFKKNIIMKLEIESLTGLHIGGSSEGLKIGGSDSPVIMTEIEYNGHKITVPYIPGSSLKGKMRSLLLTAYGIREGDKIKFPPDSDLDKIFGRSAEEGGKTEQINRTRIIVRDALPSEDSIKQTMESTGTFIEVKGENTINPITGMANPRFLDRVVPGVKFEGEIILQILEGDSEDKFLEYIREGIGLIQDSYLGGQGSRGYGKVRMKIVSQYEMKKEDYQKLGQEIIGKE